MTTEAPEKGIKRRRDESGDDFSDDGLGGSIGRLPPQRASKRSRSEHSLTGVTESVLSILAEAEGAIDLNTLVSKLSVPKRRLYDITNVLEGISVVKRDSRNQIEWTGPPLPLRRPGELPPGRRLDSGSEIEDPHAVERAEISRLQAEEGVTDTALRALQTKIKQLHGEKQRHCSLSHTDLMNLFGEESALLVVRFPPKTIIDTPEPVASASPSRRYLFLRHASDPISVYVVSKDDERIEKERGSDIGGSPLKEQVLELRFDPIEMEEDGVLDSSSHSAAQSLPPPPAFLHEEDSRGLLPAPLPSDEYYLAAYDGMQGIADLYSPNSHSQ